MGMDVYGCNPSYPSKQHEGRVKKWEKTIAKLMDNNSTIQEDGTKTLTHVHNWTNKDAAESYFRLRSQVDKSMPGNYFRANIWSWRPISAVTSLVCHKHNLPWKCDTWNDNSGLGIQPLADKANAIAEIKGQDEWTIKEQKEAIKGLEMIDWVENADSACKQLGLLIEEEVKGYVDTVYINTGCWCHKDGKFPSEEDMAEFAEAIASMDKRFILPGPVKSTSLVKSEDGNVLSKTVKMLYPAHSASPVHIREWAKFLKYCGGFQIC